MKNLERFLGDYSGLVKTILIVIWILLGFQVVWILTETSKNYESPPHIDYTLAKKEISEFIQPKVEIAKKLGRGYGPKEYFADLLKIQVKEDKVGFHCHNMILQLKYYMDKNVKKDVYSWDEVVIHRDNFEVKLQEVCPRDIEPINWDTVSTWIINLYWRTLLLVIPYYLTSMASRKGILETILAGKFKFICSIVFWPTLFLKYPANVIREIRVEAELRRFKDLFRKFSPKEIAFVREIANGSNYQQWTNQKRNYNRGLFIALTITICLHIFASPVRAQTQVSKVMTITSVQDYQEVTENSPDEEQQTQTIMLENPPLIEPSLFIAIIKFTKETWKSRTQDPPIIIPRNALFGNVKKIINQIRKGIYNEKLNDNNLHTGNWFNKFDRMRK